MWCVVKSDQHFAFLTCVLNVAWGFIFWRPGGNRMVVLTRYHGKQESARMLDHDLFEFLYMSYTGVWSLFTSVLSSLLLL